MEIAPTEKEAGKDRLQLIAHELLLARDACLQFEINLISLEHVLYNQMLDEDYHPRKRNRIFCTEITKLRENANKKFYYLDQKILKFKMDNFMDKSENQGPDEIIN